MIKIESENGIPIGVSIDDEKIRYLDIQVNDDYEVTLEVESHNDEKTFRNNDVKNIPETLVLNLYHFKVVDEELFPEENWILSVSRSQCLTLSFIIEIDLSLMTQEIGERLIWAFSRRIEVMPKSDDYPNIEYLLDEDDPWIYKISFRFEFPILGKLATIISQAKDVLAGKICPIYEDIQSYKNVKIFCEGKTDYLHLKAALRHYQQLERYSLLILDFCDDADINGEGELEKFCDNVCKIDTNEIIIAIFDNDTPLGREQTQEGKDYREWGNSVFSMKLPVIDESQQDICIELYYDKEELCRSSQEGRRLFLRDEFDNKNGLCANKPYYTTRPKSTSLIVDPVYDFNSGNNVALSKSDFADKVFTEEEPYAEISFENFHKIFEVINEIKKDHGSIE